MSRGNVTRRRRTRHTLTLSPAMRMTVVLLAIIQVIAPSWHICEMGGGNCCPTHNKTTQLAGTSQRKLSCVCKTHPSSTKTRSAGFVETLDKCSFNGTCLAKLLEFMPGDVIHCLELPTVIFSRYVPLLPTETLANSPAMPQPPVRGPPSSIFINSI